jgi:hypothetical protein
VVAQDMTDDNDQPPASKLTRSKERWAREGRFLTGKTSRLEEQRLPPGQHLTKDWPTLDLGLTPKISRERWRLDVHGAVENPIFWDWKQFSAQPQTQFISDIHCGKGLCCSFADGFVVSDVAFCREERCAGSHIGKMIGTGRNLGPGMEGRIQGRRLGIVWRFMSELELSLFPRPAPPADEIAISATAITSRLGISLPKNFWARMSRS